jgi:hypothetical protein
MTVDAYRMDRKRPLVAVLSTVPLLGEAVGSALEFADVRTFEARGDARGLLEWLRPDVLVVDSELGAEDVAFARATALPVVHISVREHTLRLFENGEWIDVTNEDGPTPEAVRNVVAGALFAGRGSR